MARSQGNKLLIAKNGDKKLQLTPEQRGRHLYVVGSTGSGKSKFLEYLIRQDIVNWRHSECGVLLLDPHGSIYDGLMKWLTSKAYNSKVSHSNALTCEKGGAGLKQV